MKVLACDQGISHLGWSLLEICEAKDVNSDKYFINGDIAIKLLEYGCFISSNKEIKLDLTKRLFNWSERIEQLMDKYQPNAATTERLFFSPPGKGARNKSSSIMNTNMITGVIMCLCGKKEIEYANFPPPTVKKAVTGNGRAQKEEMIAFVNDNFKIECAKTKAEHICDSVCIGITYALNIKSEITTKNKKKCKRKGTENA